MRDRIFVRRKKKLRNEICDLKNLEILLNPFLSYVFYGRPQM